MRLKNKVALVTGASSGIGASIAVALAEEGAVVALVARRLENLQRIASDIIAKGGKALALKADVGNEAEVKEAFHNVHVEFGRIDILVNNAGQFDGGPVDLLSLEVWNQVLATNLTGPFICTREAMSIMKAQNGGRIINMGSISSKRVRPHSAVYSATKHGLWGLTQVTALEGREYGIACSIIQPGAVAVERMHGIEEPCMSPAVVAAAVVSIACVPHDVNVLETVLLPIRQQFLGRG